MTPLGTKSVYKEKYLSQEGTAVLKEASDRAYPLFKGMFKHLCHSDPNLRSRATLKSSVSIDEMV
jgi:hypothetical protein